MTFLIPEVELAAAQARYQQAQARAAQESIQDDPAEKTEDDGECEWPKSKVGATTPCIDCGCPRRSHHTSPEPHTVEGEHAYYCVTAHCAAMKFKNGCHVDCDCQHFRTRETDVPKFTRPRVGPYDRCANPACGHWKIDHCTKKKAGAVSRLKPGELAYRILEQSGMSYGCRHFDLENSNCQCDSTGCSTAVDGNFCCCEKFISPLARSRIKSPAKPTALRKPRKNKSAFLPGIRGLFPTSAMEETDVRP